MIFLLNPGHSGLMPANPFFNFKVMYIIRQIGQCIWAAPHEYFIRPIQLIAKGIQLKDSTHRFSVRK